MVQDFLNGAPKCYNYWISNLFTGPWKTLSHAISEIREQRPSNPGPENRATINILTGIHYLSETLELSKRDSYLTIQAFNDEMPVTISGGRAMTAVEFYSVANEIQLTFASK